MTGKVYKTDAMRREREGRRVNKNGTKARSESKCFGDRAVFV